MVKIIPYDEYSKRFEENIDASIPEEERFHSDLDEVEIGSFRVVKRYYRGKPEAAGLGELGAYKFIAYAGPDVISDGRAEHLPFHVHVRENGAEYRIEVNNFDEESLGARDFVELGGKVLPKGLTKLLRKNFPFRALLKENTKKVYETGEKMTSEEERAFYNNSIERFYPEVFDI